MKRLDLTEIVEMWKDDSKVDSTEVGKELLKICNLHAKYLEQLAKHSTAYKINFQKLDKLKKFKIHYFSGRMNDSHEELKKFDLEPFPYTLSKSDIDVYVADDKDVQELKMLIDSHKECADTCSSIITALKNRGFDLRGYTDFLKFQKGEG